MTFALFLSLVATAASLACAGETVTVRLKSGRTFTAQVDPRSNKQRLWLRFGSNSAAVLRPIDWEQLADVRYQGAPLSVDQLRQFTETPAPRTQEGKIAGEASSESEHASEGSVPPASATRFGIAEPAGQARGVKPRMCALDFDAHVANWDGDVEADGLLVHIYPLDADGQLTPVNGTLDVDLTAMKRASFIEAPHSQGQSPQRLGCWTVNVVENDFATGSLAVKLPFQAAHPELDSDWSSHGLVRVRLVVPGHGVFEQARDAVRIRPFAPLRDTLERTSGRRFLPGEQTGRGKRTQP